MSVDVEASLAVARIDGDVGVVQLREAAEALSGQPRQSQNMAPLADAPRPPQPQRGAARLALSR